MNVWAFSLAIGALVTMGMTWTLPRAWIWIGIGAASFVASSLYWDASEYFGVADPKLHPVFTLTCDALVCLLVAKYATELWELGFGVFFWFSVLTSLLMMTGIFPTTLIYAQLLEACNWMALLFLSGTGIINMIGRHEDALLHGWHRYLHLHRDSLF